MRVLGVVDRAFVRDEVLQAYEMKTVPNSKSTPSRVASAMELGGASACNIVIGDGRRIQDLIVTPRNALPRIDANCSFHCCMEF